MKGGVQVGFDEDKKENGFYNNDSTKEKLQERGREQMGTCSAVSKPFGNTGTFGYSRGSDKLSESARG